MSWDRQFRELQSIVLLEDGWKDGEGTAIPFATCARAENLLTQLGPFEWFEDAVCYADLSSQEDPATSGVRFERGGYPERGWVVEINVGLTKTQLSAFAFPYDPGSEEAHFEWTGDDLPSWFSVLHRALQDNAPMPPELRQFEVKE